MLPETTSILSYYTDTAMHLFSQRQKSPTERTRSPQTENNFTYPIELPEIIFYSKLP